MAEARITEFFGDSQIREEVLDFMGLGSCMPREAWRLPSPQTLHYHNFIVLGDSRSEIGEIPDFYRDFQLS